MCSKPKVPAQPKAVWDVSQARAAKIRMSDWLKGRLTSGPATSLNPSVTITPPPPTSPPT